MWPGVRWSTCIYLSLLIVIISVNTYTAAAASVRDNTLLDDNSSGNQGSKSRWAMYSHLLQYFMERKKPWLLMDNGGYCYQQPCKKNKECCRKNNICDKSAHVCIDCWYGYPCKTDADCCERYPACDKVFGEKHGRCARE